MTTLGRVNSFIPQPVLQRTGIAEDPNAVALLKTVSGLALPSNWGSRRSPSNTSGWPLPNGMFYCWFLA